MDTDDAERVERSLEAAIASARPARLREALTAAATGAASRVRPRFCLAIARAVNAEDPPPLVWASATAIELLHCASLVHDDLPCFDDATERRGRPAIHRVWGEATALLVGDALIVAAFGQLARAGAPATLFAQLARAAGADGGLVSGQALELEPSDVDVASYHDAKTGALFEAAASMAAVAVGAPSEPFGRLGRSVGRVYQLADDLADAFGDPRSLGKPTGRDQALGRPSAVRSSDRTTALASLDAAAVAALEDVPACRGARELRSFLAGVIVALRARVRPPEER